MPKIEWALGAVEARSLCMRAVASSNLAVSIFVCFAVSIFVLQCPSLFCSVHLCLFCSVHLCFAVSIFVLQCPSLFCAASPLFSVQNTRTPSTQHALSRLPTGICYTSHPRPPRAAASAFKPVPPAPRKRRERRKDATVHQARGSLACSLPRASTPNEPAGAKSSGLLGTRRAPPGARRVGTNFALQKRRVLKARSLRDASRCHRSVSGERRA